MAGKKNPFAKGGKPMGKDDKKGDKKDGKCPHCGAKMSGKKCPKCGKSY
jgi:hypothetical protein